ncbi:drug resistance transporter, EmrB/QacA subfamily [Parafrankia irregularis]|uniref:Drug resistance transporter, EmrB/QacA subfamily n=1 Tax=Parafrankia irregularis TaxID=795642 RepID=A0A0S4QIE5_9ACTN|nr:MULTISPECIES: DHA2 family efflux MFS transporter permease subunit [Parafrankia]MBE3201047.1 DHA2 family efflux MFS transporter permease subunit [Parafrankia sp. CH37]CUU54552.1 drug resistance transporter, EmrB/QacA subfamily [Parafrankia irregularis]
MTEHKVLTVNDATAPTAAGAPDDRLDGPLVRLIAVMLVGGVLALLDATIVNVAIGTLGDAFEAPLGTIEWVSTGYLLAVAVAIPVTGWAVDRYGGRVVWLLGLAVFTGASLLASVAWSAGTLIAFRVLQGIGGGMLEPTRLTVLARAAGPHRAGHVIGLIAVSSTIGPVLGPILGGLILDHLDWRWIFLVNLPIGVVSIALAMWAVPRDRPTHGAGRRIDLLGICLLCPGFAAVVYALSRAAQEGFGVWEVFVGLGVGVALFAGYSAHAYRDPEHAVIDLRLFRGGGYLASIAVMFLVGGALFALMFLLPLYWQEARGRDVLDAGLLLAPLGLGTLIGMPLAGRLADRVGARRLVPGGAALVGAAALVFALSGPNTSVPVLSVASLVAGVGLGFVGAPTMSSVYRTVQPAAVSSATGAIVIARQIGASVGVAAVALIVSARVDDGASAVDAYTASFWWVLGGGVVVLLAGFALPGRPARRPSAVAADADPV